MRQCLLVMVVLGMLAGRSAWGQTSNSYPMLMSAKPAAAQIGATTETVISARYNLAGAYQVLVSGDGVLAEVVPPDPPPAGQPAPAKKPVVGTVKVRFTVAADAVPGVRDFRIATPQGVSTIGQIALARDPVIAEAADNDTFAKAQVVTLPATLCGVIEKAEDVDCYKFSIPAPGAYSFHVRSQRLENRIHDLQAHSDPIITLRNASGSTIATSDNVYAGDPLLLHTFAQAGDYVLEIRDVRFQGNLEWTYVIEAHSRPFVAQFSPLAVKAGEEARLSAVGFNLPADPTTVVTLPAQTPPGLQLIAPPIGGGPSSGTAVYVSPFPIVLEAAGDNNLLAQAQAATLPAAIAGVIEAADDLDCYSFTATKGQIFTFDVIARRAGSALDPVLRLLNEQGGALLEMDDFSWHRHTIPDARIESWTCPADGKYILEVRDLHNGGGPGFTYVLTAESIQPFFELELDTDKTQLAPGLSAPLYVRVVKRAGFTGEVQLAVENLPPGITATAGRVLADGQDGCIIFHATPEAPHGAGQVRITGTATLPGKDGAAPTVLTAAARSLQEIYMPGGGRWHYPVDLPHCVCVNPHLDLVSVKLSTQEIVLKPGEAQKIDVEIERHGDYLGNVTLDVLFQHLEQPYGNSLPKGVKLDGASSKTLLTAGETKGVISLIAAADAAPVEKQLIPVMAHVSINFVMKATYCGPPVTITVLPKP